MTKHQSGDGTNCRERHHHDAIPSSLVLDNHGDEMYLGEDKEDVGMITSKSFMRDELDHVPCGKLRQFWALHKGLLLALLSCFAQACGSMGVKMLSGKIAPTEIASIRLLCYFVLSTICMVYFKISLRVTKKQLTWLLLRVTCGTIGMCLIFYSYQNIPIGDTSAIIFSSPIFTGIFAWILLGEKFTLVDVALAVLTLVGIVLIARPSFLFGDFAEPSGDGNTLLGIVAALLGAIFASMVFVLIRKLGGISVHPFTQIWFFGLIGFFMTTMLTAVLGIWVVPRCGKDRFVLILVGVLGFVAQLLMTYAFKLEKATYVAVVKGNNVILAFLLEFAILGTVPFWLSIIGASLVMSSSLGITVKKWKASKSPVIDTADVLEADSMVDFWEDIYERAVDEYGPVDVPGYENNPWSVSSLLTGLGDGVMSLLPQLFRDMWYYGPSEKEVFVPKIQPGEMPHNSTIHWFRKGLRIHDNPALLTAIQGTKVFRPIFILDPHFIESGKVGINRWRFLLEALQDLDYSFRALGTRLFVVRGNPTTTFPELFKKWNVTRLTFEVDTEPYARQRDQEVIELAKKNGVEVITKVSHTLYDTERTIKANKYKPPMTYQRMVGLLSEIGAPAIPELPPQMANFTGVQTPVEPDHDNEYGVPSLEELGLDPEGLGPRLYPGGETEGLHRMNLHLARKSWVCGFEKPKTSPNSLEPSTTVLSPYLKWGCLSPRKFYYKIKEVYAQQTNCTKPPVSLMGQLIWREFFYTVAAGTPNFHQMEENPICIQVPWDENPEFLAAWKEGRTGYPYIDAIMTQLRTEGWIHHLARHSAACFLTRGDLWQSWVKGQEVFDEWLLDADYSLNAANWMWLSSSAFFHQYYRVYSPVVFGKKTDKTGEYIRKYIPALKRLPAEYIYEPWTAPRSVQEAAGCIIGRDYPRPIVDHSVVSKRNIGRMKDARACQPGKEAEKRPAEPSKKDNNGKKVRKITSMLKKK